MKNIKDLVDRIDDELCGAKEYAEKYLYYKAKDNPKYAKYYLDMAEDELKHSNYIHEIAVDEIENIEKVYKAPQEMKDKWEKSHTKYVEKSAWIKQMLQM